MRPDQYMTILPQDADARKQYPIFSGCYAYFPNALAHLEREVVKGWKPDSKDEKADQ